MAAFYTFLFALIHRHITLCASMTLPQEIILLLCDPAKARIAEGVFIVPLISLYDSKQQTLLEQ